MRHIRVPGMEVFVAVQEDSTSVKDQFIVALANERDRFREALERIVNEPGVMGPDARWMQSFAREALSPVALPDKTL